MTARDRIASCSCGQLRATCQAEPVRVSFCHCYECQRRTGSVFGTQARFPREKVELSGRATEYVRVAEDGDRITSGFCPVCGSPVFIKIESLPEFVVLTVGSFADSSFPAPTVSIFEARKHDWVKVPDGVQRID